MNSSSVMSSILSSHSLKMWCIDKSLEISSPPVKLIETLPEITDRLQILFFIGEASVHPDIVIPSQSVSVRPPSLYLALSLLIIDLLHLIRTPCLPIGELVTMIEHPELEQDAILCKLKLLIAEAQSLIINLSVKNFPYPLNPNRGSQSITIPYAVLFAAVTVNL